MKQSVKVQVAGVSFYVVTTDSEEKTEEIAKLVNTKINNLVLQTTNCTKMKAAALCAMDYCREALQLREEVEELKRKLEKTQGKSGAKSRNAESFLSDLNGGGE